MNNYVQDSIMDKVFDSEMKGRILNFCSVISATQADIFLVMARKAACFILYLENKGYITFNGMLVSDRILDIEADTFKGKKVVILDDVVVSGTTIFRTIERLKDLGASSLEVYVLGVNKDYFQEELFFYTNENGEQESYLKRPYIMMSDEVCVRTCSNIVSVFGLDASPYDIDFPRSKRIWLSKSKLEHLILCSEWHSYDVSSDLQAENRVKNITLLPSTHIQQRFDEYVGFPVSKIGFYKIRVFAKEYENKKKQYSVTIVPYFLFNEIMEEDVQKLYAELMQYEDFTNLRNKAKIRILQYILAGKLFSVWCDSVRGFIEIEKSNFEPRISDLIFPRNRFRSILKVIADPVPAIDELQTLKYQSQCVAPTIPFESRTGFSDNQKNSSSALQTKLIEPFTALYFEKEMKSRDIVKANGKRAFEMPEYKEIIDRLNHGYSYQQLMYIIQDFPEYFDKETTVSLFIDEAIDAGVIVPIVAEENLAGVGIIYYRAYRHGEDVPFGELQEKLCSLLLANYLKTGGNEILSHLRVEKLLVLFLKIGITQNIFKPLPQDVIYYKVNITPYIQGNVSTIQYSESMSDRHYLTHRNDATWLSEVLRDKEILVTDSKSDVFLDVNDNIDISVDKTTKAKVEQIGKTFAVLYNNSKDKKLPCIIE